MLVSGYFRLPNDIPKPVWRYPMSYLSFHFWALQVKFSRMINNSEQNYTHCFSFINDKTFTHILPGTIPKWSERLVVWQPIAGSSQDTRWIRPGKCFPDWCASIKMDRSQCHLQHDYRLPDHLLCNDQDQWRRDSLDQRLLSKKKNATEKWNSKYNSCSRSSNSIPFFEELCC